MWHVAITLAAIGDLLQTVERHIADVRVELLIAGLALHLLSDAVRNRGWFNILRAAYPDERGLRMRDVLVAYFSGAGLGILLPARGGDVVKIAVAHRRLREPRVATTAATLAPEALAEACIGAGLLVWAVASGHLPVRFLREYLTALGLPAPVLALVAALVVAVLAVVVRELARRRRLIAMRLAQGVAILRRPTAFLFGVATWQVLARPIRLGALACLLGAFRLPVSLEAAVTVMAVDGGARLRLGPAGTAIRASMLAYALPHATHGAIAPGSAALFALELRAAIGLFNFGLSLALLAALLGTTSPTRVLTSVRAIVRRADVARPSQRRGAVSRWTGLGLDVSDTAIVRAPAVRHDGLVGQQQQDRAADHDEQGAEVEEARDAADVDGRGDQAS